jgi:hypothetical protein
VTAQHNLGHPWVPLPDTGRGYLSVFYSDPLARWPVREATRRADNKSDPNIETLTYGLFSTCEPAMRNRIVADGAAMIFFLTTRRRGEGRVVAGYYHVGWYTQGARGAANRDYALAADVARFIDPIPVVDLPEPIRSVCAARFRTCKPLSASEVAALRQIVDGRVDRTEKYIEELQRIERYSKSRTGFSYPSWGRSEPFSWADASDYYYDPTRAPSSAPNSSKSRRWRCRDCEREINNAALLKKCPACGALDSLTPQI